jgi:hypothetical protein
MSEPGVPDSSDYAASRKEAEGSGWRRLDRSLLQKIERKTLSMSVSKA